MTRHDPDSRTSPILVVVPFALVLGTFAVIVQKLGTTVTNSDTYFHLRFGREFLGGWDASHPGSVSRFASADWVPTQWLGQIGLAAFESWFGLPGVAWISGLVVLTFALTLFLVMRAESSFLVASVLLPLIIVACAPALSPRPQVFSYLFAALVTSGWLRASRGGALPWWIVPLTWLWATLHGMWVAGAVIGLVAILGILLERTPGRPAAWKMLSIPVLSCVAAALTPMGPRLYTAVYRVGGITEYFSEWGPPEFTNPSTATAAVLLVAVLIISMREGQVPWSRVVLIILAGAWLLYSNRSVPIAAAMLGPLAAGTLAQILPVRGRFRGEVAAVLGGFLLAVAVLALVVPHTANHGPREGNTASEAVAALPDGTALLNEWNEGGFDVWLYPHLDVVIHGYGDMFTSAELTRNFTVTTLGPGWEDELLDTGATHALLDSNSRLTHALTTDKGWEIVEEDGGLSYLIAPADWAK